MSRIASFKSRWDSSFRFRLFIYISLITAFIFISLHETFSIYFDGHDYQFLKANLAWDTLSEFGLFGSITSKLLMDLIWSLEFRLFGNGLLGYRLVVLSLFLSCSILVFFLALELFKKESIALASSLFFAVHPVHNEVISWLSAQNYVFCLFFILISMHLKISSVKKRKISLQFFSFIFFLLAILSKDFGIILPLLWLVYDLLHKEKEFDNESKYFKIWNIIFFIISIGIGIILFVSREQGVSSESLNSFFILTGLLIRFNDLGQPFSYLFSIVVMILSLTILKRGSFFLNLWIILFFTPFIYILEGERFSFVNSPAFCILLAYLIFTEHHDWSKKSSYFKRSWSLTTIFLIIIFFFKLNFIFFVCFIPVVIILSIFLARFEMFKRPLTLLRIILSILIIAQSLILSFEKDIQYQLKNEDRRQKDEILKDFASKHSDIPKNTALLIYFNNEDLEYSPPGLHFAESEFIFERNDILMVPMTIFFESKKMMSNSSSFNYMVFLYDNGKFFEDFTLVSNVKNKVAVFYKAESTPFSTWDLTTGNIPEDWTIEGNILSVDEDGVTFSGQNFELINNNLDLNSWELDTIVLEMSHEMPFNMITISWNMDHSQINNQLYESKKSELDKKTIYLYVGRNAYFIKSDKITSLQLSLSGIEQIVRLEKISFYHYLFQTRDESAGLNVPIFDPSLDMNTAKEHRKKILGTQ